MKLDSTFDGARGPLHGGAARAFSLLAALAVSALVLAYPVAFANIGHSILLCLMWGIAAGFTHGVGYVPVRRLNRILLGPWVAWPLLLFSLIIVALEF